MTAAALARAAHAIRDAYRRAHGFSGGAIAALEAGHIPALAAALEGDAAP